MKKTSKLIIYGLITIAIAFTIIFTNIYPLSISYLEHEAAGAD